MPYLRTLLQQFSPFSSAYFTSLPDQIISIIIKHALISPLRKNKTKPSLDSTSPIYLLLLFTAKLFNKIVYNRAWPRPGPAREIRLWRPLRREPRHGERGSRRAGAQPDLRSPGRGAVFSPARLGNNGPGFRGEGLHHLLSGTSLLHFSGPCVELFGGCI